MNGCPTREQLERFLANSLGEDEEVAFATHLESCQKCVELLEQLTSAQSLGLSGEDLNRLRGILPERQHGWIASAKTEASGFPEVPGYRIEAELGRGGMGVVYRARQSLLNRHVALKMILNSQFATQEQVVRFLAEAQTCASIQHPGIVQIFEVGQHEGVPYFSMELLEVGTLAEYVANHTLAPREAAALVEDVARAIHAAHLRGVVHRDLKPANILLQNIDPEKSRTGGRTAVGRTNGSSSAHRTQASPLAPKITDFGLARRFDLDAGLTHTGALLGTPDYMAPEQVEPGKFQIGPAVDIYSLGAMLYFLLTGRPPFASNTLVETLEAVKHRDAASPSRIKADIPHDLSIICLHCLKKQPDDRYATAEQLAEDLDRFLNGQPISVRPASEFERLRKWARRNPGISAMAGSLLATVVIALALVTWQWTRAVDARNRESQRANSEAFAKQAETVARREALLSSSSYALDHGIQKCRAGQSRAGLLSMVRALELLPHNEPELEFAIRANIEGWRRQICKAEFNIGYGTAVVSVAFSPDGKSVLTGDYGNFNGEAGVPAVARLWGVDRWSGPPLWTAKHPAGIWSVAFSPEGKRVALGGLDGTAAILDAETGIPTTQVLPHSGRVYTVAFSPDGKSLAVGGHVGKKLLNDAVKILEAGETGELRIWDVATGTLIGEPHVFPFRIHCLTWHPSGKSIVLGGLNIAETGKGSAGTAVIFDVASSQLVGPPMVHPDGVGAVTFWPGTGKLVTGCRDGLIRFWDTTTGVVESEALYQTRTINSLAFNGDGSLLAAASGHHEPSMRVGTGEVHVWNMATRTRCIEPPFERLGAKSQKMHSIALGDGDRKLAAVSEHGRAWLWTLPPGVQPTREWKFAERCDVYHRPDGKRLLLNVLPSIGRGFVEQPCEFQLIDISNGKTIAVLPHPTMSWAVFSPDNKMLMTYGYQSEAIASNVNLWNADTGERIPLPPEFPGYLQMVHFSDDGTTLQTVSVDGQFQAWSRSTLAPLGPATRCCEPGEFVRAINPLGTRALISGPVATWLISLPDCKAVATLKAENSLVGGFTHDGATVFATGPSFESAARRWNATDGSTLTRPIDPMQRYFRSWHDQGHWRIVDLAPELSPPVTDDFSPRLHLSEASLHPSGLYYVTTEGSASDEIHFWSFSGKSIGPPIPHSRLHRVQFNPDGQSLITASHTGTVRQWSLPSVAKETLEQLAAEFNGMR